MRKVFQESFKDKFVNLELFQHHIFAILSQKILNFVIAVFKECHPDSKLTEQLFLVELHPQLRVTHHQIELVIHERSTLFSLPQWIELFLLQVEQQRALPLLVQFPLEWVL